MVINNRKEITLLKSCYLLPIVETSPVIDNSVEKKCDLHEKREIYVMPMHEF